MPVLCEGCGHQNSDSTLFCKGCGFPIADSKSGASSLIGHKILNIYRIEELLGKGGMSVVYLARHELTDQAVAVKILPPDLASQKELKARFIEEARTLARLEHPNIVVLHNFIEEEGHLFLIMQYAEGEPFDTIIEKEGRVEVGEVIEVGMEVLRALEYAHEQNVIHRDIKPSNIIIRGDGSVKVMDFGLAKFIGSTKLTQTGLTMGTVRYMSPEQVRGKQVDHRTDLYSLGITLYEALTGRTPFNGETHFDIMQQHLTATPMPINQVTEVPSELEEVINKSLEKRVSDRLQSAREFRYALKRISAPRSNRRRNRRSEGLEPLQPFANGAPQQASAPVKSPRRPVKIFPIVFACFLLLLSGGAVIWATFDQSVKHSAADTKRSTPNGIHTKMEIPWPPPFKVTSQIKWNIDQTFGPPVRLRVLSTKKIDVESIKKIYLKAQSAYPKFLKEEGIDLLVTVGPLNLAIVEQEILNKKAYWPDAKSNLDYPTRYLAPSATLFVNNSQGFQRTDLPYGFALHFCARVTTLSNQRCLDLAEGFERFFLSKE